MPYLNANIPVFHAYLSSDFLYNHTKAEKEYISCEVFGVTSLTRRCLTFQVMTEYGSRHDRVPIHYLTLDPKHSNYPLDWLQLWDCYSNVLSVTRYEYHKNASVEVQLKNHEWVKGKYLFTIDWHDNPDCALGYSEMAGGHKCGHLIWGLQDSTGKECNQLFFQPNNRVVWKDGGAFIAKKLEKPDWKVFDKEFTCEGKGKWVALDNDDYFYQFKEADKKV
jgi:hypothetical protein